MISTFIWTNIVSTNFLNTNFSIVQRYLPPRSQVNKDFLKSVLRGEKKLFKKKNIDYIHVSHYEELSVKGLWPDLKDDETFKVYFNDVYPKDRLPNHDYFFNILNTIYPEYLANIMQHAAKERFTAQGERMQTQKIVTTEEWFNELSKMPFLSCKFFYT